MSLREELDGWSVGLDEPAVSSKPEQQGAAFAVLVAVLVGLWGMSAAAWLAGLVLGTMGGLLMTTVAMATSERGRLRLVRSKGLLTLTLDGVAVWWADAGELRDLRVEDGMLRLECVDPSRSVAIEGRPLEDRLAEVRERLTPDEASSAGPPATLQGLRVDGSAPDLPWNERSPWLPIVVPLLTVAGTGLLLNGAVKAALFQVAGAALIVGAYEFFGHHLRFRVVDGVLSARRLLWTAYRRPVADLASVEVRFDGGRAHLVLRHHDGSEWRSPRFPADRVWAVREWIAGELAVAAAPAEVEVEQRPPHKALESAGE
ncbi:MAG: hypothetical protein EP330_11540 [Deltaproteobacteria bacterium]|nr:MAG: hypothetical protein EP330_11540 [Deltaproteobacteria bacterium]